MFSTCCLGKRKQHHSVNLYELFSELRKNVVCFVLWKRVRTYVVVFVVVLFWWQSNVSTGVCQISCFDWKTLKCSSSVVLISNFCLDCFSTKQVELIFSSHYYDNHTIRFSVIRARWGFDAVSCSWWHNLQNVNESFLSSQRMSSTSSSVCWHFLCYLFCGLTPEKKTPLNCASPLWI